MGMRGALTVTAGVSLTRSVPVVAAAMFQHWSETMRLRDQRPPLMHSSHTQLACVIQTEIPAPSLVAHLVTTTDSVYWARRRRRDVDGETKDRQKGFQARSWFLWKHSFFFWAFGSES